MEIAGELATPRIVRLASATGQLVSLVPLSLCLFGARLLTGSWLEGLFGGAVAFLCWRHLIVKRGLLRDERTAEAAFQRGRFADSLRGFERSEAFFARHRWVDRHRWLLLGCATAVPHEAMARANRALCLIAIDRREEAARLLEPLPEDHPARELVRRLTSR